MVRPPQKRNDLLGKYGPRHLARVDVGKINKNADSMQFIAVNRSDRVDVGKIPFGFGISLALKNAVAFGNLRGVFTPLVPITAVLLSPKPSASELFLPIPRILLYVGAVCLAFAFASALRFRAVVLRTDLAFSLRAVAAWIRAKQVTAFAALPLSLHGDSPPPPHSVQGRDLKGEKSLAAGSGYKQHSPQDLKTTATTKEQRQTEKNFPVSIYMNTLSHLRFYRTARLRLGVEDGVGSL